MVCLLLACALPARADPRIGVMTMQPGEIFWERFGHDAIVVDDPTAQGPISYNYGYFDMGEPGFVPRFIRGQMQYMLVAMPLEQDLETYRLEGRGVRVQWLDLTPAQATSLQAFLQENARPENMRYRYDYFTSNCSTRVRDALDRALGGTLQPAWEGSSLGNTYRDEATRLARPSLWMWLVFELGLGPSADTPLTRWQNAFVPMQLADNLDQVRTADGKPLVTSTQELLPHRLRNLQTPASPPVWGWWLVGLSFGLLALRARKSATVAKCALPFWCVCGLLGVLMLYAWLGTAHWAAWRNLNLLLLSPLCLLLLPGGWRIARGRAPGRVFTVLAWVIAGCAVLALLNRWFEVMPQQQGMWIGLLLPIHAALAWVLARNHPRMID